MSTHIIADREICCGSGRCYTLAPSVFDCDDDGIVVVLEGEPDEALRAAVRNAVEGCPTQALRMDPP
jgi:ferredoxin